MLGPATRGKDLLKQAEQSEEITFRPYGAASIGESPVRGAPPIGSVSTEFPDDPAGSTDED
eukprot:1195738-Prorocentrum_minimum.AAC.5